MSRLMEFPDIKQPSEKYFLGFDFSLILGSTITISSAVVSATLNKVDATTGLIDAEKQLIQSPIVYFWVKDCAAGTYRITCKATASDESIYEIDAILKVTEL